MLTQAFRDQIAFFTPDMGIDLFHRLKEDEKVAQFVGEAREGRGVRNLEGLFKQIDVVLERVLAGDGSQVSVIDAARVTYVIAALDAAIKEMSQLNPGCVPFSPTGEYEPDCIKRMSGFTQRAKSHRGTHGVPLLNELPSNQPLSTEMQELLEEDRKRVVIDQKRDRNPLPKEPADIVGRIDYRGLDNLPALKIAHLMVSDPDLQKTRVKFQCLSQGKIWGEWRQADGVETVLQKSADGWKESSSELRILQAFLKNNKTQLIEHQAFQAIDSVINGISLYIDIFNSSRVDVGTDFCMVTLHEEFKDLFPEIEGSLRVETFNPFNAKASLLVRLGFAPLINSLSILAQEINYYAAARTLDLEIECCLPEFIESEGFVFRAKGLQHAGLATKRFNLRKNSEDKPYLDALIANGLLMEGTSGIVLKSEWANWRKQARKDTVVATLEAVEHDVSAAHTHKEIVQYFTSLFDKYQCLPYANVEIDDDNRIQVVTAPHAKGKSVFLKAVEHAISRAMSGVHCTADSVQMSLCDQISSNFFLLDSIEGVSTFRAQMRLVVKFLTEANPRSLGLFDELFHGTSAPYLVALGWAVLEEIERLNLRVIISTHEQFLSFFGEENGIEQLRGKYQLPRSSQGDMKQSRRPGIRNLSLGDQFALGEGAVFDSEPFRIAEEEGLPSHVIQRARDIFGILTSPV